MGTRKSVYALTLIKNLAISEERDSLFQIGKQVRKPRGSQCCCDATLYLSPQWKCFLDDAFSFSRQRNHVRSLVLAFAAEY